MSIPKRTACRSVAPVLVLAVLALTLTACESKEIRKVKIKVDQTASVLNVVAKSNRELYRSGAYGIPGSPEAISRRQTVARGIYEANEFLAEAVETAARLRPGMNIRQVIDLLVKAARSLAWSKINNEQIDPLIQSGIVSINAAIALAEAVKEK